MTYPANVINVMIASPSDTSTERRMAQEVIHEWNSVHSQDRALVLMPVGWESHSSPKLGARPQEIINAQVLDDCDLLIAVFWTRLGSPTGDSPSGTVEEIRKHVAAGKPAMVYFSDVPVQLNSVDDEQYRLLRDFREECKQQGLIETYQSISEFREKLTRQIAQTILREFAADAALAIPERFARLAPGLPPLSEEGSTLLREAASDENGTVMMIRSFGGLTVQTNGMQFVEQHNPRSEAAWEAAIQDLVALGLLEERGYRGEIFGVTHEGYALFDRQQ